MPLTKVAAIVLRAFTLPEVGLVIVISPLLEREKSKGGAVVGVVVGSSIIK